MMTRVNDYRRRVSRWLTRSYWAIRLFGLSKFEGRGDEPGLILVQIDGLSYPQFRRALHEGNLPFLRRLARREKYREHHFYSGLPSSTPAVQGELFYGVKGCVPAFNFVDQATQRIFTMYDPDSVTEIEKRLKEYGGKPLLEGGSSYSNIYNGGAKEDHFCAGQLSWKLFFKLFKPVVYPILFILHFDIILRILLLLAIEFMLAIYDFIRGAFAGQSVWMEAQFIFTRVAVCIFLREVVVMGANIDIARGLPIIHVNFFGYDEQAHRRGPTSKFAHWVLRGIDDAVSRIWKGMHQAERRNYDLWIYSDHGQEDTRPYKKYSGKTLYEQVLALVKELKSDFQESNEDRESSFGIHLQSGCCSSKNGTKEQASRIDGICVTGMGPLAHIYFKESRDLVFEKNLIEKFLTKAGIPAVLYINEKGKVQAWKKEGIFDLPEQASEILDDKSPFFHEMTEDLIQLCRHPSAGRFILAGWCKGFSPISFPMENGSHAGFAPHETHGFSLLPQDAPVPISKKYLRPLDLREAALRHLKRSELSQAQHWKPPEFIKSFRVMTYNVHGCVGMDGKLMPERIARVIARHDVDAICLQELDVQRKRSRGIDQAAFIAEKLQMKHYFHPSYCIEDEQYGNAILSRYPIRLLKMGSLPKLGSSKQFEPRGVLWVELNLGSTNIQILNTHLSIWPRERLYQTRALLGDWIGDAWNKQPLLLCGDFNASPGSASYRLLNHKFKDAQKKLKNHRPGKTWWSPHPITRIDHIFMNPYFDVVKITVPETVLECSASDHRPLIAEFQFSASAHKVIDGEIVIK